MTFERFVCWDRERVERVMRIDADSALPAVFMAVHTDEPLRFHRPEGRRSAREFLEDFLTASGDVRAVVIGGSGSGKSHLVRWMELNIPPDRHDLHVVRVPRSGTSLRSIVRRLMEVLPTDVQDDYREKLVAAPDSPARFRELELRLLTEVALALERSEYKSEIDANLATGMNAFFLDPEMRNHHTGQAGIIADLVKHITGSLNREDRDTRRRFEEVDLHLDSAMRKLDKFAAPTVTLLRILQSDPQLRVRAVALVNDQLDSAVSQTLGLSAGELTELLNGIRTHLRTLGKTLVMLIEDFVRTEGIDRALLDALIDSRDDLCDLRLLIAVTTGYYERELIETQKTRLNYIIDLDRRPALDEGDRLAPFVVRYLNALRVEEGDLARWYEESRIGGTTHPLPNACTGCQHRKPCHANFGSRSIEDAGDVGLYPFTSAALDNMVLRMRGDSPDGVAIDPRALLRDVLRPIVGDRRAQFLEEGSFPDPGLVENHGGRRLPLDVQRQVRIQNREQAERQLALLELWSARPGEATQLAAGLYKAFALDPLTLGETPPRPQGTKQREMSSERTPSEVMPSSARRRLEIIRQWHNGGNMTAVTDDLRHLVMSAVMAAIDWDAEGLERAVFAGGRGSNRHSFRRTSISFARQDTVEQAGAIKLRLPIADDPDSRLRTAQALEGLVNFHHYGHWNFPGALDELLAVSHDVPFWAEHVARQLRCVHDSEGEWDPVASAVEVLAVGATLGSRPAQLDASCHERLSAILDEGWPAPDDLEVRSDLWRDLYRKIHASRGQLRELVLAHASAMKGGQSGSMLDASRVVGPLRIISRDWRLRAAPPARLSKASLPDRYRRLVALHSDVLSNLPHVAEDERLRRIAWLGDVRDRVPEGVARREVVDAIERLREAVEAYGIAVRRECIEDLENSLQSFRTTQLDEAIRMAEELKSSREPAHELLPRLAGGRRGGAMRAWEGFRNPAERFLDDAESKIQSESVRIGGVEAIEQQYRRVGAAFTDLEEALAMVVEP